MFTNYITKLLRETIFIFNLAPSSYLIEYFISLLKIYLITFYFTCK